MRLARISREAVIHLLAESLLVAFDPDRRRLSSKRSLFQYTSIHDELRTLLRYLRRLRRRLLPLPRRSGRDPPSDQRFRFLAHFWRLMVPQTANREPESAALGDVSHVSFRQRVGGRSLKQRAW